MTEAFDGARITEADSAAGSVRLLSPHTMTSISRAARSQLPDAQGFQRARASARSAHPHAPIMVISGHEQPDIVARTIAHGRGTAGFVAEVRFRALALVEALRTVLSGRAWVPPRTSRVESWRSETAPVIGAGRRVQLRSIMSEAQAATLVSKPHSLSRFACSSCLCSGVFQNKRDWAPAQRHPKPP